MRGSAHLKLALASGLLVLVAAGASNCQAKTFTTCADICGGVPPCNETYNGCLARCASLEDKCERVGHPAAFLAYLTCTSDGGFSCDDAGQPVASALCEQEQADLVECDSENDAGTLDIPDGAFEADLPCADAVDCSACCRSHHEVGARMYAALVTDCVCTADTCRKPCSTEACASKNPSSPQPNDACDQCITGALNDLSSTPGVCVLPVTLQCNQVADCALFVNCGAQSGCEP